MVWRQHLQQGADCVEASMPLLAEFCQGSTRLWSDQPDSPVVPPADCKLDKAQLQAPGQVSKCGPLSRTPVQSESLRMHQSVNSKAVLEHVDPAGLPFAYRFCGLDRNSGLLQGDSDVPHSDDIAGGQ
eukprot:s54_g19.t1